MLSSLQLVVALAALAAVPLALTHPSDLRAMASRQSSLPSSNHCGDYDYVILTGTPWIVYNMLYNADLTVGTQCTYYNNVITAADGTQEVVWSSTANIKYVESTNNVPKGYSFVGLTQNLETPISDIGSIPATYDWTRTNTSTFKGNVCFDFMTSDTKGDSTSTAAQELMLWLQYEGGQLPIGWGDGTTATIDSLFGTSWKLYEGLNEKTGIMVRSLLPEVQFDGSFTGDLKDWLEAMVTLGRFKNSTYVNVGNAGTEFFYGDSVLKATLGLQINKF